MRSKLTMVCLVALAACADVSASTDTDTRPEAGTPVAYDAGAPDATGRDTELEDDASAPDAASDAAQLDAGASDAGADGSAPAPVVLTLASYRVVWDHVLGSRCRECHSASIDDAAPLIDIDFGLSPLLRVSSCQGMPYVTPGDPSRSLLWRVFQADAPCGVHRDPKLSPPLQPSELERIAAWIRGELEQP